MSEVVQGIDTKTLVSREGPFLTAYLNASDGSEAQSLARRLRDLAQQADASDVALLANALELIPAENGEGSLCIVTTPEFGEVFTIPEPLTSDIVRVGNVPSLGSLVESAQMLPSHAVLTIDGDEIGMTTFDSRQDQSGESSNSERFGSLNHAIEALRFVNPAKLVLAGSKRDRGRLASAVLAVLPETWIDEHDPVEDQASFDALADDVVRSAAALRAEWTALELGRFRAAASANATVEDDQVVRSLRSGDVTSCLVHDDPDDVRLFEGDRMIDVVVALCLRDEVPLTMIPNVGPGRGPANGIGAITSGHSQVNEMVDLEIEPGSSDPEMSKQL